MNLPRDLISALGDPLHLANDVRKFAKSESISLLVPWLSGRCGAIFLWLAIGVPNHAGRLVFDVGEAQPMIRRNQPRTNVNERAQKCPFLLIFPMQLRRS
jgi:hypothetical protein